MDPASLPLALRDSMELDGHSVPRIFVSALSGAGVPDLRALLSSVVLAERPIDALPDDVRDLTGAQDMLPGMGTM